MRCVMLCLQVTCTNSSADHAGEQTINRLTALTGTCGSTRNPDYLGLRNLRMNWSVCPRIVWSNTSDVRGSAGLARIELSESNLNPAASTSRRTVEDSMRCKVSVTFAGAPRAAE